MVGQFCRHVHESCTLSTLKTNCILITLQELPSEVISSLLRSASHSGSLYTQAQATKAILFAANLSQENTERIPPAGGIQVLSPLLASVDPTVRANAALILSRIAAFPHHNRTLFTQGLVSPLRDLLHNNQPAPVYTNAAQALTNLLLLPSALQAFFHSDGIRRVVQLLRGSGTLKAKLVLLDTMCRIGTDQMSKIKITAEGGSPLLIQLLCTEIAADTKNQVSVEQEIQRPYVLCGSGNNSDILGTLTTPSLVDLQHVSKDWTALSLLDQIAQAERSSPPCTVLIDTGHLITQISSRRVAEHLLKRGLAGMAGVVYLDEDHAPMILVRESMKVVIGS